MARQREIRTFLPRYRPLARVSRSARLLFVGLFTVADDEGRARASPAGLAYLLFPVDADAPELVPAWLDELEREGLIERYKVDGIDYLHIVDWRKFQYVRHPTPSRLPPAPGERHA